MFYNTAKKSNSLQALSCRCNITKCDLKIYAAPSRGRKIQLSFNIYILYIYLFWESFICDVAFYDLFVYSTVTVQYSKVQNRRVRYRIVEYSLAALNSKLYLTSLYSFTVPYYTVLHCTILHYTELYCTVLQRATKDTCFTSGFLFSFRVQKCFYFQYFTIFRGCFQLLLAPPPQKKS